MTRFKDKKNKRMTANSAFKDLSEDVQEQIREKQRLHKLIKERKREAKKRPRKEGSEHVETTKKEFPRSITRDEYFNACPLGLFYNKGLRANESSVDLLLRLIHEDIMIGRGRNGETYHISDFNYYVLPGAEEEMWNPVLYARLAYEGFFTITTESGYMMDYLDANSRIPLPELQPFYSVIDWVDFNVSKYVKRSVKRLLGETTQIDSGTDDTELNSVSQYQLFRNLNPDKVYTMIDDYQKTRHGVNWLTPKYYETIKLASADPTINFSYHTFELYDRKSSKLIAGEIGYSIGKIYTSLSGASLRDYQGAGILQLVCLGKWLQKKGYDFWSLGHCYCPEMEYKRRLGHRVYPRDAFLEKVRECRGLFRGDSNIVFDSGFVDAEECNILDVIQLKPG